MRENLIEAMRETESLSYVNWTHSNNNKIEIIKCSRFYLDSNLITIAECGDGDGAELNYKTTKANQQQDDISTCCDCEWVRAFSIFFTSRRWRYFFPTHRNK